MLARLMVGLIKLYQVALSPMLGQNCRFAPSCSQYAVEAIRKHGAWRGAFYTIRRLSKCHPWHDGGHDPVP
ncbi:membrane protein insertion efficiency factor YidD [Methylobacillus rhizosphaerae]|nr:membrane protein insertion efficiency factor YidD [Methylobacillus rhizosphaerae]